MIHTIRNTKAYNALSEFQKYTRFGWNEKHMAKHFKNLLYVASVKGLEHVLNIYHVKNNVFKTELIKELHELGAVEIPINFKISKSLLQKTCTVK